ncbi:alpha-2-macroglobulin-like [Halichoeres trimaculatus]|uniref:alpha-2-macroglobulin-like n=1 Tax=Halichoeres trimaculatus TaxID=147232 RepID=UPI003D9EA396
MYLVLSRGNIVRQGHQKTNVHNHSVTEGEISFTLKVTPDLSPRFQLVAYTVLPNEIVIADSENFPTEKCFSNKVSLGFSPTSAVPGEGVTLKVSADPGSICGVSAVDQSVLIAEPGKSLDTDKIFELLPDKENYYNDLYYEDDDETCLEVGPRRSYSVSHSYDSVRVGLKMVTNMFTKLPLCLIFKGKKYYDELHCGPRESSRYGMLSTSQIPSPETKIRTFFPETWIWNIVDVGESGSTDLSLTVPDTITTWETEAFCLSPQGFGLAPHKTLTVFLPFFLELSLPYSTIRGEQFALKATVFNYLSSCIMVTVSPAHSSDYTLTPLSGEPYTSCLCASDQKTFSWTMSPSVLGVMNVTVSAEALAFKSSCDTKIVSVPDKSRIDVVTRSLIVKAEGTVETKTYNWLLCPNGGSLTEEVELQLPENVIAGSAQATLSVLGDTLGRALRNFDGLLQMPHGSGEQNMALMASNIYILEYLKNTQQLTPAIKEKAANFLTNGYQRQLNYKHEDGAYSNFVKGEKNTWLTAFVLRSFVKASSFIFIDSANIAKSKTWLESKQQGNGCFELSGKLLNNEMKGGVSDEVTLSAYIIATFLEMNMSVTDPVAQSSLSCIKESISYMRNTYTTALLAYVFTLAGDMETRALLLRNLDAVAIQQGGALYWSQKEQVTALSVEISSYVLLAKLSVSPTAEDLGYSARIVKWLTGQQNEYGGFSSTQDTVVALQALALYSTRVFSHEGSSTVTVQSPSGQHTFDVNPNNRLLYQEVTLKTMAGKYSLEVKGAACAAVQISLRYNIPILPQDTTVYMEAQSEASCIGLPHRFDLKLKSLHRGYEMDTNMVIMEIKLLTGYRPNLLSLAEIQENHLVDRVDHNNDLVVVYLKELPKNFLVCHIDLIKDMPVQNLKPGFVKIYDLYEPSCHAEIEYTDPCAAA